MSAATKRIYAAVAKRADGYCECGCGKWLDRPQLDHALSRRVPQSVANCWMLTAEHHEAKTNNRPSAAHWLELFIIHARRHGYAGELARAESRLVFVKTRTELAAPRVVMP